MDELDEWLKKSTEEGADWVLLKDGVAIAMGTFDELSKQIPKTPADEVLRYSLTKEVVKNTAH